MKATKVAAGRRMGASAACGWPLAAAIALCGCAAAGVAERDPGDPLESRPAPPPTASVETDSVQGATPAAGYAWVVFGEDTVHAEVARTAAERSQGLQNRDSVPAGTGMLFVFDQPAVRSFWMQNTLVALDIAFIDEHLEVVDIKQMEPETTNLHTPSGPALYALEVPKGWLADHDISPGDRAVIVFGPARGGRPPGAGAP